MDDRQEREAALESLSSHSHDVLSLCSDSVEMLDAFEELAIIDEEEKEDANDNEDYGGVIKKLHARVEEDPSFFLEFCRHIQNKDDLAGLAQKLLGKFK